MENPLPSPSPPALSLLSPSVRPSVHVPPRRHKEPVQGGRGARAECGETWLRGGAFRGRQRSRGQRWVAWWDDSAWERMGCDAAPRGSSGRFDQGSRGAREQSRAAATLSYTAAAGLPGCLRALWKRWE
jgi:hypothetical protein